MNDSIIIAVLDKPDSPVAFEHPHIVITPEIQAQILAPAMERIAACESRGDMIIERIAALERHQHRYYNCNEGLFTTKPTVDGKSLTPNPADAKPAAQGEVCKLCGGTYEECQHRRCYGFVNGQRKPSAVAAAQPAPALSRTDPPPTIDNAGRVERVGDKQSDEAAVHALTSLVLYDGNGNRSKLYRNEAHGILAAGPTAIDRLVEDLAAMKERAERAEALAKELERCGAIADKLCSDQVIAARAEADAAKQEAAALRARKVKLPLMFGEPNKGDPPDIAHGWKMYDDAIDACADAIRAAGVGVEESKESADV